jgi:hypothetical protein
MLRKWKEKLISRYATRIREKAITRAKTRIALSDREVSQFSKEELEVLVKEEEDKIKNEILGATGIAALIILGLN